MNLKFDLDGNPIKPPPKCRHCGKRRGEHKAVTYQCPGGKKHRTFGYPYFLDTKYEAKA